jgi:hypothetical protein
MSDLQKAKEDQITGNTRDGFNLFFRPKGFLVETKDDSYNYRQQDHCWIIQWQGTPFFDSGYQAYSFNSKRKALKALREWGE